MALFPNEQIADVSTPDGRTLRIPQNVLGMLQMPSTAGAAGGPPPLTIPATTSTPPAADPNVPPDANEPPPLQPGEPYAKKEDFDAAAAQQAEDAKKLEAERAAKQKPGKPTQATPAPGGPAMADASAKQKAAVDNEANATAVAADIEQAALNAQAGVYNARNEQIDKLEAKKQADMQAAILDEDKKVAEVDAVRKKIANTRIDRKLDHPILGAISVALFELGSAMKGDTPGRGVEMLYQAIDRKVAAQMADLDQMGKVYGLQKDALETLKEKSKRKLEFHNAMIAAETDKAARQLEEMAARTQSQKVKANVGILVAQLQQRAADKSMEAVRWGLDYDQKERAEKNQNGRFYAGLRQAERFHADDVQLKREDMALDLQKALMAEKARGDEAAYKAKLQMIQDNETRGLRNTNTGEALLTAQGRKMMEQADALAQEAKSLRELDAKAPGANPASIEARAKALEEKASMIRGEAQITQQIRHRDPTQAGRLSDEYSAVQNMGTLVDEIKQLYTAPGGGRKLIVTDENRAAIQSKMTELTMRLKNAWQLGVLSKQDTALINQGTGGDPTKFDVGTLTHALGLDIGTDPNAFMKRLDSLVSGSEQEVALKMKATNFGGSKDDLFEHRKQPKDTPEKKAVRDVMKDKTPLETADAARAKTEGTIAGPAHSAAYALNKVFVNASDPGSPAEEARRAENSGSLSYPGLSKEQGVQIGKLLQGYKAGNEKIGDALVEQAVDTSRPQLSVSMFHVLRSEAPDLYEKARARVKEGPVAEQLDYEEKNRIATAETPLDMLEMQASGDPEAYKELARRASNKDAGAGAALLRVIQARQSGRDPLYNIQQNMRDPLGIGGR